MGLPKSEAIFFIIISRYSGSLIMNILDFVSQLALENKMYNLGIIFIFLFDEKFLSNQQDNYILHKTMKVRFDQEPAEV